MNTDAEPACVSRGAGKLRAVFEAGLLDVRNRVCFDVGSSTGGFTDLMLRHGARRVYCCDVGRGLLHERLRADPRVVLFEGVNFRYFREQGCAARIAEPPEVFVVDVSFISLRKILPVITTLIVSGGRVAALVKPQFECPRSQSPGGVVKDPSFRRAAVDGVACFARSIGFQELGRVHPAVTGPRGNVETFLILKRCDDVPGTVR